MASRCSPPRAATTEDHSRTSMLSVARICATRYIDIESSSRAPRTSITTRLRVAGEVQRGLPGGVRGADDVDLVALALARLAAAEDP